MKTLEQRQAPRYSRERWEAAQASWKAGEPWSDEWRPWRHLAAQHGIPGAPEGTEWDQWDDDHPSERAQVIRAIRETPAALSAAIRDPRTHAWASVVAVVVRGREHVRQDAIIEETPGSAGDLKPRQAASLLGRIATVVDETARMRLVAAKKAGRCPTCGQEWA